MATTIRDLAPCGKTSHILRTSLFQFSGHEFWQNLVTVLYASSMMCNAWCWQSSGIFFLLLMIISDNPCLDIKHRFLQLPNTLFYGCAPEVGDTISWCDMAILNIRIVKLLRKEVAISREKFDLAGIQRVPRAQCDFSPVGVEWRYHGMLPQSGHRGLSIASWCPIVVFAWDLACWGPTLGSRAPCRFEIFGFASSYIFSGL